MSEMTPEIPVLARNVGPRVGAEEAAGVATAPARQAEAEPTSPLLSAALESSESLEQSLAAPAVEEVPQAGAASLEARDQLEVDSPSDEVYHELAAGKEDLWRKITHPEPGAPEVHPGAPATANYLDQVLMHTATAQSGKANVPRPGNQLVMAFLTSSRSPLLGNVLLQQVMSQELERTKADLLRTQGELGLANTRLAQRLGPADPSVPGNAVPGSSLLQESGEARRQALEARLGEAGVLEKKGASPAPGEVVMRHSPMAGVVYDQHDQQSLGR